jgi:hypothetical protein
VLLIILKLITHNKKTTTETKFKNTYIQMSKIIGENCRARTTVANAFAKLIMIGTLQGVTPRKGQGASGKEIELDIPSKEKLKELLYQEYRLEDAKNVKLAQFI